MKKTGLYQLETGKRTYVLKQSKITITLSIYVNDITMTGKSEHEREKTELKFKTKRDSHPTKFRRFGLFKVFLESN